MKRVVVIAALSAVTYFASQHAPQVSREEDEVPDMSAICIVDAPEHMNSEVLTPDQLAMVYASDGVRDKDGELVLSPLLERDKSGKIAPAPGAQGPWRRGDLTAQLPWYAPWMMVPRSGASQNCYKSGNKVPEPGIVVLTLAGLLILKWRMR